MTRRSTLRSLPGVPRVRLHEDGGRRAHATRALTGASDWRRRLVDSMAFTAVAVAGTGRLPAAGPWPWPDPGPEEVEAALRRDLPGLQLLGSVLPRQPGRRRLSVLCRAAGNPVVVKLGTDERSLRAEHRALELLAVNPLPGIATPRPFGVGVLALPTARVPIVYLAVSALGLHAQHPAIDAPLRTFETDLAERLKELPAPDGEGDDLVPVHGDLTPWNLRRTGRGLALFDWESVGWGPPGSDLANYRHASDQIRPWWRRTPGVSR